jgi:hypothetical protein
LVIALFADWGLRMKVSFRRAAQLAAAGLVFLFLLAPPAGAVLIADITLQSAPPEGYPGPLIDASWTPDDVSLLPSFAKATIGLAPGNDYWVGVIAGGWAFRVTNGQATEGCTLQGCDAGWLNLFFVRDDRGDVPVGFSDPTPFSDNSSHFPTQAAAAAAAQWHQFDVGSIAQDGGTDPVPVSFYIYDIDYTDNAGALTLALYEGTPPPRDPQQTPIPEPSGLPLLATALCGLVVIGRFRTGRKPLLQRIG